MIAFQILYVLFSVAIFAFSISKQERMIHGFAMALMANSLPLVLMPQFIGLEARFFGVPIAYLPIMGAGVPFLLRWRHIHGSHVPLILLFSVFLPYITVTSFYRGFNPSVLPYYFAWIFNFSLLLAVANYFLSVDISRFHDALKFYFNVLIVACLLGIFRRFSGIADDANFMPMMNRNGTVVVLVSSIPLLYFLRDMGLITKRKYMAYFLVILATVIFINSRAGMICFAFSFIYLNSRISSKSVAYLCAAAVLVFSAAFFDFSEGVYSKLGLAAESVSKVLAGGEIASDAHDYQRYMLMKSAFEIIEHNFWFGVGVGVPNYQAAFAEYVGFFERDSKAHNFYVSYFAELGLVGFCILLALLAAIYRRVSLPGTNGRCFKAAFFSVALVMTMSEYILLPELWFFFGMLLGYVKNRQQGAGQNVAPVSDMALAGFR